MRTFSVDTAVAEVNIVGDDIEIEFGYEDVPWSEEVESTDHYTIFYGPINGRPYLTKIVMSLAAVFNEPINITILDDAEGEEFTINELVALLANV